MSDLIVELLARRPPAMDDQPERLQTLLELLDRPDRTVPTVWVAGDHGRSSVITMMAALLAALDVTAGAATRPHLQDLRERLRVAGAAIGSAVLREQLEYLAPFLGEVDTRFPSPLGFDEVMFAMAATWFADAPVDVALHEGGPAETSRQDLVVALAPSGGTIRVVDGGERLEGSDFGVVDTDLAVGGQRLQLRGVTQTISDVYLPLHGAHQARNAATALAAVEGFLGYAGALDAALIRRAFAGVRLPGRLEVVRRPAAASVALDGARDPLGAAALAAALRDEFTVRHRIGVLGVGGDDPVAVLRPLAAVLDHVVVTQGPAMDAAAPADVVAASRALGLPVEQADTMEQALELASGLATTEDVVVVAGGLPTAGAARRVLGLEPIEDLLQAAG